MGLVFAVHCGDYRVQVPPLGHAVVELPNLAGAHVVVEAIDHKLLGHAHAQSPDTSIFPVSIFTTPSVALLQVTTCQAQIRL